MSLLRYVHITIANISQLTFTVSDVKGIKEKQAMRMRNIKLNGVKAFDSMKIENIHRMSCREAWNHHTKKTRGENTRKNFNQVNRMCTKVANDEKY